MITNADLIKKLQELPDDIPANMAMTSMMLQKIIDYPTITKAYVQSIEHKEGDLSAKFNEGAVLCNMVLSGNWKEKHDIDKLHKRMLHYVNANKTIVPNIYNKKYNYTEDDKKEWDEFYERIYGYNID